MTKSADLCPCGATLEREMEHAYGVCDYCRVEAHRRAVRRRRGPDPAQASLDEDDAWDTGARLFRVEGWPDRSA